MIRARILTLTVLVVLFAAGVANASWYDDYDAGIAAARKGSWQVVVQKMTSAINGNAKEDNHARTYGAIFINYHPYYYRAVANLNLGRYEQAISDFEKTSGPGETDLGTIEALMLRAKGKLEAASAAPEPEQQAAAPAARPAPVQAAPAAPAIDPGLRQRVVTQIAAANGSLASARNRKAGSSPQYQQAIQALADANNRLNLAKSNDDLNAALGVAQNAALYADSAVAPGAPPPVATANIVPTKPVAAAEMALSDYRTALRRSLASYFAGDFDIAAAGFEGLTRAMPNNGWVWAFLGASKYSQYAFEADESYKQEAIAAFKRAKASRNLRNGLPEKYFSKRIRKFFNTLG